MAETTTELAPAPKTISEAATELQTAVSEKLHVKIDELDAIFQELEKKLGPILLPLKSGTRAVEGMVLKTDEGNSMLFNTLQDVKGKIFNGHNALEFLRNKVSELYERVHI